MSDIVKLEDLKVKQSTNGRDKPVYNWDDISYGESEEATLNGLRMRAAEEANDAEGLKAAFLGMRELVARYLLHVPRSWLVSTAPSEIDWSDPDSISRYLKSSRAKDLFAAFNDPADASGGSEGA